MHLFVSFKQLEWTIVNLHRAFYSISILQLRLHSIVLCLYLQSTTMLICQRTTWALPKFVPKSDWINYFGIVWDKENQMEWKKVDFWLYQFIRITKLRTVSLRRTHLWNQLKHVEGICNSCDSSKIVNASHLLTNEG